MFKLEKCFFFKQKEDGSIDSLNAVEVMEPLREHNPEIYEQVMTILEKCSTNSKGVSYSYLEIKPIFSAQSDSDPCIFASTLAECAINEAKAVSIVILHSKATTS